MDPFQSWATGRWWFESEKPPNWFNDKAYIVDGKVLPLPCTTAGTDRFQEWLNNDRTEEGTPEEWEFGTGIGCVQQSELDENLWWWDDPENQSGEAAHPAHCRDLLARAGAPSCSTYGNL